MVSSEQLQFNQWHLLTCKRVEGIISTDCDFAGAPEGRQGSDSPVSISICNTAQTRWLTQPSIHPLLSCNKRNPFVWARPLLSSSSSSSTTSCAGDSRYPRACLWPLTIVQTVKIDPSDGAPKRGWRGCAERFNAHLWIVFGQLNGTTQHPTPSTGCAGLTGRPTQTSIRQPQQTFRIVRIAALQGGVLHRHQGGTVAWGPHLHIRHLHEGVFFCGSNGCTVQTGDFLPVRLSAQRGGQTVLHGGPAREAHPARAHNLSETERGILTPGPPTSLPTSTPQHRDPGRDRYPCPGAGHLGEE